MLVADVDGQHRSAPIRAPSEPSATPLASLSGRAAREVLPLGADAPAGRGNGNCRFGGRASTCGCGAEARHYLLEETPLKDRRGFELGRLFLLHDVTEQRRAQARLVERERAVATLQERERLARELHDGVGQVLGYLSLQAQTARKRCRTATTRRRTRCSPAWRTWRGMPTSTFASRSWPSMPRLRRTGPFCPRSTGICRTIQAQYGIRTELSVADDVSEESFESNASVQLLRVIQEALTNARKHGAAGSVCVSVGQDGDQACIAVTDDGCGFDPQRSGSDGTSHFGLVFMRERMARIEGSVTIESGQGAGTSVKLKVPIHGNGKVKG